MSSLTSLNFPRNNEFYQTLNKRVNEYFRTNNISRHGNREMTIKTIVMLSIYFVPYILLMSGVITNVWVMLAFAIVMGLGMSGIGLSIMHDANHGAYSKNNNINNLLGLTLNLVGGSSMNWKIQHNVLHHTYTNVHEHDEDISPRGILRMTPESSWRPVHKFQHRYAWFFYGLMTMVWVFLKDWFRVMKYHKEGLLQKQKTTLAREIGILVVTKIIYILYIAVIPMMVLDLSFGQWFIGFFAMQYTAGFILAIIFQPAHVIEGTEFPVPDSDGNLENSWAVHQLATTTNFANKSRWFSWYVGGLNFQVEHHLFPTICHVHYRHISPIVRQTAEEFGLKYKDAGSFWGALVGHAALLKELGKRPETQTPNQESSTAHKFAHAHA